MALIRVMIGGSHAKYRRQFAALQPFAEGNLPLRIALGSKRFALICFDSPQLRAAVKACGATIARTQPAWLNAPDGPTESECGECGKDFAVDCDYALFDRQEGLNPTPAPSPV